MVDGSLRRPAGRGRQTLASSAVVEHFAVAGGARLAGEVDVVGAKNSALKLMAAALLAEGRRRSRNCPEITDVAVMAEVLRRLGCTVTVDARHGRRSTCPPSRARRPTTIGAPAAGVDLRARAAAGPVRRAAWPLPGGDAIGSRPLDMHVAGLRKLGRDDRTSTASSSPRRGDLHGAQIWLDFPSVGATENLLMAAVLAKGITVIDNAAREPEIVDICAMLTEMGAQIDGAGTSTLTVEGVDRRCSPPSTASSATASSPAPGRSPRR